MHIVSNGRTVCQDPDSACTLDCLQFLQICLAGVVVYHVTVVQAQNQTLVWQTCKGVVYQLSGIVLDG